MGTKANPGQYDCYASLEPDEPYFLLAARDPMAPALVRNWAMMRQQQVEQGIKPSEDMAKAVEARQCAAQMEIWRSNKLTESLKQPVPPRDTSSAPEPAPAEPEEAAAAPQPTTP